MTVGSVGLWVNAAAVSIVAYLIGGIPWSLIIGKRFFGIDPRQHGSGNLGATNVLRLLGVKAAIATAVLDAAKGAVAVGLARVVISGAVYGQTPSDWVAVGAMMAAVLGHTYSPYIRMRGGKGVATSAGALTVLTPVAALIELILFVVLVTSTRIVSLASVIIAVAYPPLVWWLYGGNVPYTVTAFALAALVIWRHRANIGRIARRQEPRISLRERGKALRDEEVE